MGGVGDQLALCAEGNRCVPKMMPEAILEFKCNANIVSQLHQIGFYLLAFPSEVTTVGKSFS